MKIITWNVNGIRARQAQFVELVERETPDLVCLQELKAKKEQIPETCTLPGYSCYWHGAGAYSGVALHVRNDAFSQSGPAVSAPPPSPPPMQGELDLGAGATSAPPLSFDFTHPAFDLETRIVQVALGDLIVASVYVPNGGKDFEAKMAFMHALKDYVRDVHAAGKQLVLCGDLNVALTDRDVHPKERKPNAIGQLPEERDLLASIIAEGLVDVGRALDPDNDNLFTWWAPWRNLRQRNIGWRLDYVLASRALADKAESCVVQREFGTSDHGPVIAQFR